MLLSLDNSHNVNKLTLNIRLQYQRNQERSELKKPKNTRIQHMCVCRQTANKLGLNTGLWFGVLFCLGFFVVILYFKQSVLFSLGQCEMTYWQLMKSLTPASLLHVCQNTLCNTATLAKFSREAHPTTSISLIHSGSATSHSVCPCVCVLVFYTAEGKDQESLY